MCDGLLPIIDFNEGLPCMLHKHRARGAPGVQHGLAKLEGVFLHRHAIAAPGILVQPRVHGSIAGRDEAATVVRLLLQGSPIIQSQTPRRLQADLPMAT